MDKKRIEKAVREILLAVGENPRRPDIKDTPRRVSEMYEEILSGMHRDAAKELEVVFEKNHDEIILLKDIPLYSICEHHLLPFIGKAHVAYIPKDNRVTGLSKLARVVDVFSKRLQVQERLTMQIANEIREQFQTEDVAVAIEATHLCVAARGVEDTTSSTITSNFLGKFATDEYKLQFLSSLSAKG